MSENKISEYSEQIIKTLTKYLFFEDSSVSDKVKTISQLLGLYVDCDILIPLMLNLINELDSSALKNLTSMIIIFANILVYQYDKKIEKYLEPIINFLLKCEQHYSENAEILQALYEMTKTIIEIAGDCIIIYVRKLFSILLTIQSAPQLQANIKQQVQKSMEMLAIKSGYSNISELHANEIQLLLDEFIQTKSYEKWTKFSHQRYKFEVIIRNCQEGIEKFLQQIFEIITVVANPQNDIELRMDMLCLVEFILNQKEIKASLKQYSIFILTKILIPSAVWRVGKPNIKIRRAAVINMINMIDIGVIDAEQFHKCLKELIPVLKSNLQDDWGPDLRFTACNLLEHVLILIQNQITSDELREIYPSLLERLDDAQDVIRIEITKSLIALFKCEQLKLSPSTFDYVIKQIFIHLDDQNENIQIAIFNTLKHAIDFSAQEVLKEAQISVKKQKYPRKCQEIIKLAEEASIVQQQKQNKNEEEMKNQN